MIVIPGLSQPQKAAGKCIDPWVEESDALMVKVDSTVRCAACPRCLKRSSRLHGHYRRVVADSPSFGRRVTLAVEIRRFKCIDDCCAQRTFLRDTVERVLLRCADKMKEAPAKPVTRMWRPSRQMSRLSKPDSAMATPGDRVGWPAVRR